MVVKPGRCLLTHRLNEINKTQSWLCEKTGMSRSQVSDYATNRKMMSYGTAMTIAEAIGCNMDNLYEKIRVSRKE